MAGDPEADGRLLRDDFVGVYPSGFSDKAGHCSQLDGGPTVIDYVMSEEQVIAVTADDVLLMYRADYQRPASGSNEPETEVMYVSSLWHRSDDGHWLNIFSQDTVAEAS